MSAALSSGARAPSLNSSDVLQKQIRVAYAKDLGDVDT
jgi:hypothetical protein